MHSMSMRDGLKLKPRATLQSRSVALVAAFVLCLSISGWAQDQATIVGLVTDTSGAVVPGVKITVSNPEKGFTRETTSNSAGDYTVAKMPIGDYNVEAQASGFQKLLRTGITLTGGQTLRVDLQLTVGQVTQEITVMGNVAKVETENGTVSNVITGKQVTELNLNGRNWMALTTLVPGVAPMNTNNFNPLHVGFGSSQLIVSFNGSRVNDANVEVDGGNVQNEPGGGRNIVTFPNVDSIAEFRISTSDYGADIGKRPGAVIEVVTKGGTKAFHGTAYEFLRNDAMDANAWFLNRAPHPASVGSAPYDAFKQPLKWNLPGYNIGGPFYIPGHYNTDKTKTFFFWSQTWARYREGTVFSSNVPSLRMRQGDFSECDPASGNYNKSIASGCVIPKNPATGLPMDTLAGAGYTIDPNAAAMMAAEVPLPNAGLFGYASAPSLPDNYRQENIRIDQNIGTKTSIFGRYTQEIHRFLSTGSTYDTTETQADYPSKTFTFHVTHSFRPNLLNEFIASWEIVHINQDSVASPTSPAHSLLKPSNWTAVNIFPANATNHQTKVLPALSVSGGLPFSFAQSTAKELVETHHEAPTLKDNIVYTVRSHTLKFGFFFEDFHNNDYISGSGLPQGRFVFNATGAITTGNGLADTFLGRIASYTEQSPVRGGTPVGGWGTWRGRFKDFEPYFQDDWKVSRRLTVNLGLRYQYRTNWHDGSNPTVDSGFIPSQYSLANEAQINAAGYFIPGTGHNFTSYGNGLVQCGVGGVPVGCLQPYYRAFGPRFGFAYDPRGDGKTAIRGGYGIFYDIQFDRSAGAVLDNGPPPNVQTPTVFDVNGYTSIAGGLLGPTNMTEFPQVTGRPRFQQFNLTLEHEFRGNNLVSIAYVGSLGTHLDRSTMLNQVPLGSTTKNVPALAGTPGCDASGNCNVQSILINTQHPLIFFVPYRGYNSIQWRQSTAVSNYHSLQASYRHSVGHGMTVQGAYTWMHAIDDSSDGASNYGTDDWNNLSRWRATSDFNRSQTLQLNYVYELPFFRSNANHFVKNGLGGWQLSGISSFFTGIPINFSCTENKFATGIGTSSRCNSPGPIKISKGVVTDTRYGSVPSWFDAGSYTMPLLSQMNADGAPGMFGYMARNPLIGPGRNNWDIALMKLFQMPWFNGEHSTLQFRWETFNTFNHTQWMGVQSGCNSSTPFGVACNDSHNLGNSEVTSAWNPRQMQLGLKFNF